MAQNYKIKELLEDFIVIEKPNLKLVEKGEYIIFTLKKKNYTTERAVQQIADALHIDRKRIGYAGSKDSKAVTEQSISIKGAGREKIESLKLRDLDLGFVGYANEPISLGDLEGNSFEIVVRNIDKKPKKINRIINYFGEQRFSKNNAEIGKAIIKKDFKKAVDRVLDSIGKEEERVIEHLKKSKNDFVGALKEMPWKTLNMYIHAYQSKLLNELASKLVKKKHSPTLNSGAMKLPLIGFASEIQDKDVKKVIDRILQNEGVTKEDFVIRAIPDLSSAGNERELFVDVKDLKIGELEDDELNKGKKKVKISFSLGKGSYATEVIKVLFSG
ncbi:MAG TPA: tRNA pseudouridine(13) synthase TruD [Candidatus Nanoarchaeia archaeon]|nr:tRNA pseudouridine(13) synthase TruD [Candidatus Nanoarchaeia archaeon]